MNLMHGAQFTKKYVNDYLEVDIPTRIISYRNGWGVDNESLPTPEKFLTYEPLALDIWPTIITVAISTNKLERIGFDRSDPIYRVEYQMRTYVWVRSNGSEEATVMRDRLTTVIRSALLDYPCLKAYDERESFRASIDESSMREEFSDLTLLKGDRVLAGSYIAYIMQIDEVVSREDIGIAEVLDVKYHGIDEDETPVFHELQISDN